MDAEVAYRLFRHHVDQQCHRRFVSISESQAPEARRYIRELAGAGISAALVHTDSRNFSPAWFIVIGRVEIPSEFQLEFVSDAW